jgi:cytochrome c
MKKLAIATLLSATVLASGVFAADGKALFAAKACTACHSPATEGVGPALKRIAATYKGDAAAMTAFLKGNDKSIVDPAKYQTMKVNIATTKALPAADLDAIVTYILSNK